MSVPVEIACGLFPVRVNVELRARVIVDSRVIFRAAVGAVESPEISVSPTPVASNILVLQCGQVNS